MDGTEMPREHLPNPNPTSTSTKPFTTTTVQSTEPFQNHNHILCANGITNQHIPLLEHDVKRIDDLVKCRRGAAFLSVADDRQIRLLALLEDCVELCGEFDGSKAENYNYKEEK